MSFGIGSVRPIGAVGPIMRYDVVIVVSMLGMTTHLKERVSYSCYLRAMVIGKDTHSKIQLRMCLWHSIFACNQRGLGAGRYLFR